MGNKQDGVCCVHDIVDGCVGGDDGSCGNDDDDDADITGVCEITCLAK